MVFSVKCFYAATICVLVLNYGLSFAADISQLVKVLPGQPPVNFKQYAGHIIINNNTGKAFFYWFYEADNINSSSLPLLLWLNGGPGCSSIGAGALGELGPFRPNDNGSLTLNPYSWNKDANIIFLESPVGVGFSYSKTSSDYDSLDDENTATDNLMFLINWFTKFPEYSKHEFYIAGESYAGHYIPTLVSHILEYNSKGGSINFKGYAIGNAWTAAHYESVGNGCYSSNQNKTGCSIAFARLRTSVHYVDAYNVYKENCASSSTNPWGAYHELLKKVYVSACDDPVTPYLNSPDVQAALHVTNRPVSWHICSSSDYSQEDIGRSVLPLYTQLLKSGIRIWIYSGDFDSVVSTLSTRSWLKTLNLTVHTPWHPWSVNGQVGGWTQIYEGLTFTTIRGAGHMVPTDQPASALVMFQNFLMGSPLPTF